ncbi:MAG: SAM-dependent methyltransferase [Candidatus Limnocylindrales bacterium]
MSGKSSRIEYVGSPNVAPPMADPGEPVLVDQIRDEIERDGPITFARFMELALYEPGLGYYAISSDRTTRQGDFLTAPEMHPIFGWTLAGQIEEMWTRLERPETFTVREYGAGSGALGRQLAERLAATGSELAQALVYEPIEVEPRMQTPPPNGPMPGCVIGNELLDALPAHRVRNEGGSIRELMVGWKNGSFVDVPSDPSDERLAKAAALLPPGHSTEVSLATAEWLRRVYDELTRGWVVLIDYGLPESDLLAPSRATGTVRAFRDQHVSSDVLSGVGRQDITYHVNLDALERDAAAAGFDVIGRTNAARFLLGSGLDEVYRDARAEADLAWDTAALLRSSVRRLLDTGGLGGYAVIVLGKAVQREPLLRGLGFRAA